MTDRSTAEKPKNDFIDTLEDRYKWGTEALPFDPNKIVKSEVDHSNFRYEFVVPSQFDARALGQQIGVGTLFGDLGVFSSEVFLGLPYPAYDFRLDGGELSYTENRLEGDNIKVTIQLLYHERYPETLKQNIKASVDKLNQTKISGL